ncbi:SHOCT domain-containing protein [Myroides sp. DW712]|uniref:SHOCT domain-containing protein n=1 Tax=Myroides sp. DW712 TaxID=3389800 RepID=UPI00397B51ED
MKTINFKSGTINIDDTTISFQGINQGNIASSHQVMERKLIGGVNYQKQIYLKRTPLGYANISMVIGIISLILYVVLSIMRNSIYVMFLITLLACAIFFITIIFSLFTTIFFDTNWDRRVCEYLFGKELYLIVIQNKSNGQHIEFYINLEELEQAKELIEYKLEEVSTNSFEQNRLKEEDNVFDLDKINTKLNELRSLLDKGIISNEEFQLLKSNLINTSVGLSENNSKQSD